jgi:hypothetical protein
MDMRNKSNLPTDDEVRNRFVSSYVNPDEGMAWWKLYVDWLGSGKRLSRWCAQNQVDKRVMNGWVKVFANIGLVGVAPIDACMRPASHETTPPLLSTPVDMGKEAPLMETESGPQWVPGGLSRFNSIDDLKPLVEGYLKHVDAKGARGRWFGNKRDSVETGNAPYTHAGLASWLGISMPEYDKLRSAPEYRWSVEFMSWVDARFEERMIEGALSGEYVAAASDLIMKNRYGFSDKVDVTRRKMSISIKVVEIRDRAALSEYKKGGMKALEAMGDVIETQLVDSVKESV